MPSMKNIMVSFDLTEMDELLIQYVAYLCKILPEIDKVYFFHNIKFNNREDAQAILAKLDKPLGEIVVENITELLDSYFEDQINIEIIIEEASSTPNIISKVAKENKVDLLIVGKKLSYKGSGLVVEKLIRILPNHTSTLLIPETAYHRINNILVPIDFSKNAKTAIVKAVYLQKQINANLSFQHVLNFPSFYFPTMIVSDLEPVLKERAEKSWKKFAKELTIIGIDNINCELSFNWEKNIVQTIYDHAVRSNNDLIVMSSKGRGGIAAFAVGSIAMQMVKYDLHIPLLIVKSE